MRGDGTSIRISVACCDLRDGTSSQQPVLTGKERRARDKEGLEESERDGTYELHHAFHARREPRSGVYQNVWRGPYLFSNKWM